jgi:hypothetical protein
VTTAAVAVWLNHHSPATSGDLAGGEVDEVDEEVGSSTAISSPSEGWSSASALDLDHARGCGSAGLASPTVGSSSELANGDIDEAVDEVWHVVEAVCGIWRRGSLVGDGGGGGGGKGKEGGGASGGSLVWLGFLVEDMGEG